jgi:hypothetical protein
MPDVFKNGPRPFGTSGVTRFGFSPIPRARREAAELIWTAERGVIARSQSRSDTTSVQQTVCWIFLCPCQACSACGVVAGVGQDISAVAAQVTNTGLLPADTLCFKL